MAPLGPSRYDSPRWQGGAYARRHVPTGLFQPLHLPYPEAGKDDVVFCYKDA